MTNRTRKTAKRYECKCDGTFCAATNPHGFLGASEINILLCMGYKCLQCGIKSPETHNQFDTYHMIQCHCDDANLSVHCHYCPLWWCSTKCERRYKKGPLANPFNKPGVTTTLCSINGFSLQDCNKIECEACRATEKGIRFLKCGRCKRVSYCSKKCQTKDWAEHKPRCTKS